MPKIIFKKLNIKDMVYTRAGLDSNDSSIKSTPTVDTPDCDTSSGKGPDGGIGCIVPLPEPFKCLKPDPAKC